MATIHVTAELFTPRAKRWLHKPQAARLLHLFDEVINLIDADGEIISVAQSCIGAGPFSLVVAGERPFPALLSPSAPVTKSQATLTIGSLEIDYRQAKLWQPVPNWQQMYKQQDVWLSALPEMETAVLAHLHFLGSPGPANFKAQFQAAMAAMEAVLLEASPDGWPTAVTQLAGLGPGLTPAGDDFLVGLLYGLWATHPAADVAERARVVVETAVPRTTQLSAAWLQAAGRGEAVEPWHDLVNALLTHTDWQLPLQKILQTGATSGAAAVMGFVTAVPHPAR